MRLTVLSLLFLSSAAAAQEAPIIVTGRGLAEAQGDAVYDIVTLDRDRLTGSASGRLDELLKDVPGFQLFRRSDARSANPTSQGATLRALGGNASSRALLVLDGVPQTDPFGGWVFWPAFDPRRLGEVRVVRGGGSGVYGPGALAGTIEMMSAGPADLGGVTGVVSYGSRESADISASLGSRVGAGFVTMSGQYARGDGFIPVVEDQRGPVDRVSPYEQASLSARALVPVSAQIELQASGLLFRDRRERGTAFSANETEGADASLRLVGRDWSLLGYWQDRDYYNSFASVGAGRASVSQVSEQYDVPSTGLGARAEYRPAIGPVELRIGADWRRTDGATREYYSLVSPAGPNRRAAGGLAETVGAYAEGTWVDGPLTVTAGGRIDRWSIRDGFLDEAVVRTGAVITDTDYPDRSGWRPTGRAGAAYQLADAVSVRGAAYLGWRLPTLNELYRPFRVGNETTLANPELAPERLHGAEAGLDWRPVVGARLSVTSFWNVLEDGIANITAGTNLRRRGNLDRIEAKGVELDAAWQSGDWSLGGGYSYASAKVRASGAALPLDGARPAQTPSHTASARVAWRRDGTGAALSARYVSSQFEDDLNQIRLPDALTFDAVASLRVAEGIAVEGRVENLTNARVVAAISSDGLIERATPRTLWIGLRVER